ncbi:MAG: hypothetical protein ACR2FU_21380 [Streptosporangiaceae bacterium]
MSASAECRERHGRRTGLTLAAALRILGLEDDLAAERALTARLRERLAGQDRPGER